jgi:hypothetical protein
MIEIPLDTYVFTTKCAEAQLTGDTWGLVACWFIGPTLGWFGWLFMLALLVGEIIIYWRTENLKAVGVVGVVMGTVFMLLFGEAAITWGVLIILVSAAILIFWFQNK